MEEFSFVATTGFSDEVYARTSDLMPTNPNLPYDMKEMIRAVADNNSFFELQ